ncbi:hypothetical protein SEA_LOZINAK_127 [Gordonia phage Lozinak]|uniref:Uncharacterized protein n=2 Tax=Smoothievirus smoothie TaxID=1982561 RepID=A0A2D1GG54_9CAUD|nr:hypothetical protein BEN60_gp079 [Gordonia phage Smoothie]ANA86284.1 hypothetical protein PBI_SMOOTHIE_128 [Gordonia phage Smoothie]ATN90753.1 hypothetical protein SEA_LOZINAK_127 [Gordonia phage Lozinak]
MDPFRLASVWIPPEYVKAYQEGLAAENSTKDDFAQALTDIHVAVAKMSHLIQRQPFPVNQIMAQTLTAITDEVTRIAMERYVFREVLTIPDRG